MQEQNIIYTNKVSGYDFNYIFYKSGLYRVKHDSISGYILNGEEIRYEDMRIINNKESRHYKKQMLRKLVIYSPNIDIVNVYQILHFLLNKVLLGTQVWIYNNIKFYTISIGCGYISDITHVKPYLYTDNELPNMFTIPVSEYSLSPPRKFENKGYLFDDIYYISNIKEYISNLEIIKCLQPPNY